jgi:DNA-binding NtrC family response regulator
MGPGSDTAEVATLETVLVVEDDVLIRLVIAGYLRDCGFRVIEAANADEAMAVMSHAEHGIGVVFTDIEMPGDMDGFGLSQWVRRERPGVEVILAGTPARAADAATDLCEQGPALARPYDPKAVLERIRRLLALRLRP